MFIAICSAFYSTGVVCFGGRWRNHQDKECMRLTVRILLPVLSRAPRAPQLLARRQLLARLLLSRLPLFFWLLPRLLPFRPRLLQRITTKWRCPSVPEPRQSTSSPEVSGSFVLLGRGFEGLVVPGVWLPMPKALGLQSPSLLSACRHPRFILD